nr:uncharacterized protein LOC100210828 isoform X2 [Hydra vulgaris]
MYSFCKAKINGIYFKLFSKEEIDQTRAQLEKRYLGGRTVPGTRMYHHFIPIAPNTISYKKICIDACTEIFDIIPKSKHYVDISLNIKKMDYIACFYDGFWWVGIAEDVSELDIKVRFMHPHEPDDDVVQDFLWMDKCYTLSDKYLLAMVYTYFRRAKLNKREYTRMNFFVALYLAHDVEEDNEDLKLEIYPWALGLHWKRRHLHFISQRDALLKRMKFRAIVSKLTCDEVILLCPSHPIWKRERKSHHGGAVRIYPDEESENFSPVGPNGVQPFCMLCATWVPPSPTLTSGYLSSSCILDFSSVDNSSNNYFQHLLLDETNSNSDTNFGQ